MEFLQLRTIIKYNISKYGTVSFHELIIQLDSLELPEISNLEFIGAGVTTKVFKKNEDTAVCISVDISKVSYLKKEFRHLGFKFIKFVEYVTTKGDIEFAMIYEMPLLSNISYGNSIDDDVFLDYCCNNSIDYQSECYFDDECKHFIDDLGVKMDYSSLDKVMNRYNAKTDIHEGQFMRNDKGAILCIDPIISNYIAF